MNDIVYTGKHLITYSVLPHSHDSWELIYCTSGSGEIVFESSAEPLKYQTGDLVVIPPGLVHSNFGEKGFTNIHLNNTCGRDTSQGAWETMSAVGPAFWLHVLQ